MRARVLAASFAVLLAARVGAQGHPDFNGVWVLDPAKTVLEGSGSAPSAATVVNQIHGDTIVTERDMTTAAGSTKSKLMWVVDGKPWKNTVPVNGVDTDVSSVLSWDKGSLVIRTTLNVGGNDVLQVDTWTLGSGGRSMTIRRAISVGGQDYGSATQTFNKKS
jgi:hypothetical protein